jgi:L-ascorbate metabolism protein UlaG (beta-lactamase superfamily)
MDVQNHGANCITLTTRHARVVIDDNLVELGAKSVARAGDIALFTAAHSDPAQPSKIIIDQPGEYEVSNISIYGFATRAHMDEASQKTATMYKLISDDVRVLVVGHVYPEFTDKQLEAIGLIDVMIVPVGGNGYTLDGVGALKLIKKIEPKIVIPTNYDLPGLNFPVPQQTLQQALQSLAMEAQQTTTKLKLKESDLVEGTRLIVLEKI